MRRMYVDPELGIRNRHVSMHAKKIESWCMGCDAVALAPGKKCPKCGHVQGGYGRKRKRKSNLKDLDE